MSILRGAARPGESEETAFGDGGMFPQRRSKEGEKE
jgi:hypothetical protein